MSYTPKNTWVRNANGELLQGIKNNGIIVAIGGQEIDGELAIEIEKLENQTKRIPQMVQAETKATDESVATFKVEIKEEKPKQIKKKNANSK